MRKFSVYAVAIILWVQAAALLAISGWLVWASIVTPSAFLAASIFLDGLVIAFAIAAIFTVRGFHRGQSFARGAILVWQMLFIGVGIASAQGVDARLDIAIALGAPAAFVAVMVLFSPVIAAKLAR